MKIGIASDHAGVEFKTIAIDYTRTLGWETIDYGVDAKLGKSVDYPDFASAVAEHVSQKKIDRGILICGSGIGMSIVANKFPYVRASVVWDEYSAKMCRAHNDANIMCIGSRVVNQFRAFDLIGIWLNTEYEGGRHEIRLSKLREIEKANFNL